MAIYLALPMIIGALALGWAGGMLTFRRSMTWCSACGQTLSCRNCLRKSLIGKS